MAFPYGNMKHIGNKQILEKGKTAFLCSRNIPAGAVLRCYDWAIAMRNAGQCVISGFHSTLEKDVLHYLLKGTQPVILVQARGLKTRLEPPLQQALDENRLLIVSPFEKNVTRVTEATAFARNTFMLQLADTVTAGYVHPGGNLEKQLAGCGKPITYLFKKEE